MIKDDEDYLRRLGFEHELINRRIGWLLTSQSILLLAYGLTVGQKVPQAADRFRQVVPIVGLLISYAVLCGVVAAVLAKRHIFLEYRTENKAAKWGAETYVTWIGLIPDFALPMIFAWVWLALR
jgi:hypothetical protein